MQVILMDNALSFLQQKINEHKQQIRKYQIMEENQCLSVFDCKEKTSIEQKEINRLQEMMNLLKQLPILTIPYP